MAEPYLESLTKKIDTLELPTSDELILEFKHFFSGAALYANGKICASLTPAGFGLKVPGDVRKRLIDVGEGGELHYFVKAPVKKMYVVLPQAVVDDPQRLRSLLELSIAYVLEE